MNNEERWRWKFGKPTDRQMAFNGKIICIEKHQRKKELCLTRDTKACEWGQKREDAKTCGDCFFGLNFLEFKPKYNTREVIKELESKKKDIILDVETIKKEVAVMCQ